MAQKFIAVAVSVCMLVAFVQSAPQIRSNRGTQRFQPQTFQPQTFQPQQFQQQQFQPQQPQFQARSQLQHPQFQAQSADPEKQSRFLVVDEKFEQNPDTKEYNFE